MDNIRDYLNKDNIISMLQYYGATDIDVRDNIIRCTCPIHKGNNKTAFVWNLETHLWYCHVDKIGGDLIRLHAIMEDKNEKNDWHIIVDELCNMLGIDKSKLNYDKMLNEQRKELRSWINFVNKGKLTNKPYDLCMLGTSKNINAYKDFTKDILSFHNVFYASDLNRIAFPIQDENNVIVGASCRTLQTNDKIKWLHRPKGIDTGIVLYNLNNVIKIGATTVYIVEGITDVLRLKSLGILNVVCSFGCGLTEEQIELLSKYFIEIIMFYDNDIAGVSGNIKSIEHTKDKFDVYAMYFGDMTINDAGDIKSIEVFNNIQKLYYIQYLEKVREVQ